MSYFDFVDNGALWAGEEEDVYDPGVFLEDRGIDFTSIFENDFEWDSVEEAIAWARAIGRPYKITLTRMNSNPVMVKLGCDQAGKARTNADAANSKKCNCKFVFMGHRDKFTGKWTLKLKHGMHNHDLPSSYLGHPYATRPTSEEEAMVRTGSSCFTSPRILSKQMVDKNPENCTSTKQISNLKQKIRLEGLGRLTVCQWTLQFLRDENYITRKKIQQGSDIIEILMFIHPSSLHLMKLFPYLIVMDCIYNTNPYNMYLMEMVGMTCTNKSFNIGFAFLCNEDTPTYTWILQELRNIYTSFVHTLPTAIMTDRDQALINAIHEVFPEEEVQHLLCWVHIRSNIEAHANRVLDGDAAELFADACWGVFMSTTEASYEVRLANLLQSWNSGLVGYVQRTWLNPHKKNIVRAWTDYRLHFFCRTSNRVEGMHSVLKKLFESAVMGFDMMVRKIHHQLESQIRSVRTEMEMSRIKTPNKLKSVHRHWRPVFKNLIHNISEKCFRLLLSMYDGVIANQFDDECVDHWWRDCYGIPCIHRIANAMLTNDAIRLDEIHDFWKQVSWEGVPVPSNEILLLPTADEKWNAMIDQHGRGDMSADAYYQIASTWADSQNPSKSRAIEPYNKEKGRPKGSKNFTKRRDKTYLEHMEERQSRTANRGGTTRTPRPPRPRSSSRGSPRVSPTAPSSPTVSCSPVGAPSPYLSPSGTTRTGGSGTMEGRMHMNYYFDYQSVDVFMFQFITDVRDVIADGHCGYRSLASVLGWSQGDYIRVKQEMYEELTRNFNVYQPMALLMSRPTLFADVAYIDSPCSSQYWLEMPDMGLVFATRFNVAVVLLSWDQPHTCLPMAATWEGQSPPTQVVAMAHVGQRTHFIPVWLANPCPLPPPPLTWTNFHHPSVHGWDAPFLERMEMYRYLRVQHGRPRRWLA